MHTLSTTVGNVFFAILD